MLVEQDEKLVINRSLACSIIAIRIFMLLCPDIRVNSNFLFSYEIWKAHK
jgi:hypothetical protein